MINNPITVAIRVADPDYRGSLLDEQPEREASPQCLAALMGVTYQAVRKWEAKGYPPANRALEIESVTEERVTRYQLRPDLYPVSPAHARGQDESLL